MKRYVAYANDQMIGHAETKEKAQRIINRDKDKRELIKPKWFETAEEYEKCNNRPLPKYTIKEETIE